MSCNVLGAAASKRKEAVVSEEKLIAALKRREPDALAAVFEQYADRIYRLAVSLLHDEQQADGVVQNTFLALIESIHQFEGRSSLGTWLYRVGYNECRMRQRSVRPDLEMDAVEDPDMMPQHFADWSMVPDHILEGSEARAEMDKAIQSLKPEMRSVFVLRDVEGLSTEETARIMNISEGAVKVRLHRARLALREKLAAYFTEFVR